MHTTGDVPLQTQLVPLKVLVACTPVGKVSVKVRGDAASTLPRLASDTSVDWLVANTCTAMARPLLRGVRV